MEGSVPNHFYLEMNFPAYMKQKLQSTAVLWEEGELSMREIQHVGIAVSRVNGCEYCTGAFCTTLDYGLDADTEYPGAVTDEDVERLREVGLGDMGIVQLTHVVSDFASYNRLNTALDTDYDYQDMWREADMAAMNPAGED